MEKRNTCTDSIMYDYFARNYKKAIQEVAKYSQNIARAEEMGNDFLAEFDRISLKYANKDLVRYKAKVKEYIFNTNCDWTAAQYGNCNYCI